MTGQRTLSPDERSSIDHVGTYQRRLPVNLERMYENALDWEHLPYVHSGSFAAIECLDAGAWGWRAALTGSDGGESEIELRLDRSLHRWITRNLSGPAAGAEIWTHVFELGASELSINVDFFVPGVPPAQRSKVGSAYAALYARLYDEDVAMMVERQRQLDRRPAVPSPVPVDLGPASALPDRSLQPFGEHSILVLRDGERWFALPAQCPHQLGPLLDAPLRDGCIECPWHGYQFMLNDGRCRTRETLQLRSRATARLDSQGHLWLVAADPNR